jgi:hypothetical protein
MLNHGNALIRPEGKQQGPGLEATIKNIDLAVLSIIKLVTPCKGVNHDVQENYGCIR